MNKLSFVDKGFLLNESREQPMHVAGVSLYTLPEGADEQAFLHELAANLRDAEQMLPPFGDRLKSGRMGLAGSTWWEADPALDLDYHIRHSALPGPGRYRELFTLVSRLHGTLLDRNRPLWETHLIEGLQNRQFAVYNKTHHAAVDGARSIHVARCMLSDDPNHVHTDSPMSLRSWERYRASLELGKSRGYSDEEARNIADILKAGFDSSIRAYEVTKGLARAWSGRDDGLSLPHLKVPRTVFNTSIGGARRFVAQSWPFPRLRAVGKAFDGTFNDTVLAMCAGALRRYLERHAELPDEGLKAMVPVSVRQKGDINSSNAVGTMSADLATHIADPIQRMSAIQVSTRAGKAFYEDMSPNEVQIFSMLLQTPSLLLTPLGLAPQLPPFNLVISNVPGIRETQYWNGARMDGSYPLSIVMDGIALNITLLTYDQNVDFGIIACRRSVPQVQRMIDYMEESLQELEDAAGFNTPQKKSRPGARKKSARKTPRKAAGRNATGKSTPRRGS